MNKGLNRVAVWLLLAALLAPAHPAAAGTVATRAALVADKEYHDLLLKQVREAKRRIICAFYLFKVTDRRGNLPAALAQELVQAKRRGVEVAVILEGDDPVGPENRLVAAYLTRNGVKVRYPQGRRTVHAKAVVVDDRYVLIGSHNITHAALSKNRELSVLLDSPELAAQTTRYLEGIR